MSDEWRLAASGSDGTYLQCDNNHHAHFEGPNHRQNAEKVLLAVNGIQHNDWHTASNRCTCEPHFTCLRCNRENGLGRSTLD